MWPLQFSPVSYGLCSGGPFSVPFASSTRPLPMLSPVSPAGFFPRPSARPSVELQLSRPNVQVDISAWAFHCHSPSYIPKMLTICSFLTLRTPNSPGQRSKLLERLFLLWPGSVPGPGLRSCKKKKLISFPWKHARRSCNTFLAIDHLLGSGRSPHGSRG